MHGRSLSAYLRWSDYETIFNCDEISDRDNFQRGEHFYGVGFFIRKLDFLLYR